MQQNFSMTIIFLLASSLLLLLFIHRKQRKTMAHIKQNLAQQINTNDQLNKITTELRRSTKILSMLANINNIYNGDDINDFAPQEAKLYVGNLDYSVTEQELERVFAKFGDISNVNIPLDRYTGKARGFGFVTFSSTPEALKAMELNGYEIKGRSIQVNFAKER